MISGKSNFQGLDLALAHAKRADAEIAAGS
jgi:hypothetical protein